MRARLYWLGCALGALTGLGCGGTPSAAEATTTSAAAPGSAPSLGYVVRIDPDLETLDVELCASGIEVSALVPARASAAEALTWVERIEPGRALVRTGARVVVPDPVGASCFRYRVDVGAAGALEGMGPQRTEYGRSRVLSPSLWLWRPSHMPAQAVMRARFALPPGISVAIPWPRDADLYVVPVSAFTMEGYAAFGDFALEEIDVPGGVLEVAQLNGERLDRETLRAWLGTAGDAASRLHGRFPCARTPVLVIDAGPGERPVYFGAARRGGGGAAVLLRSSNADAAALRRDWVAVHELTHLGLPYADRGSGWLSEGLATYYQEVLSARAGAQTAERAWARLVDGFDRGARAGSGRPLEGEAAEMRANHTYLRVYWAGAALALLLDVAIRTRTAGARSLDDALSFVAAQCAEGYRITQVSEVLAAIDRAAGAPLSDSIVRASLASAEYPPIEEAYRALGLSVSGGRVLAVDPGEGAALRAAIMGSAPLTRGGGTQ